MGKKGKFKKNPIFNALPINTPKRSTELAEFIGILLGDGGITKRQVTITLHRIDDRKFANHVNRIFRNLFKIKPSIRESLKLNIMNIVVSRTKLIAFLLKSGLKEGGKVRQQVEVPSWIKNSKSYTKSCIRGLFDTDGCFYVDRHYYKDKIYYNCGMNFTNRSFPLLFFFKEKLEEFSFHPTHNTKFSVCLRKEKEIIKYFNFIGSSNPKHLNKFKKYFKKKFGEVPKWT